MSERVFWLDGGSQKSLCGQKIADGRRKLRGFVQSHPKTFDFQMIRTAIDPGYGCNFEFNASCRAGIAVSEVGPLQVSRDDSMMDFHRSHCMRSDERERDKSSWNVDSTGQWSDGGQIGAHAGAVQLLYSRSFR